MTTLTRYTTVKDIDLSDLLEQVGCVGSSKKWYINPNNNAGKHIALPVTAGEKYVLSSSTASANSCWCAYLTDSYNPPYTHLSTTPHVSGYDRFSVTTVPTTITIPEGCAYLAMSTLDGNETPNSFTFTLQQYATENAPYTVNGIKCFQVTDTWDGEIDAGGILIDDAYNIDTFQITGNNSTEQLSLLAQVMNVKSQIRLYNYEYEYIIPLESNEYEEVDVDVTIGSIHITRCFYCMLDLDVVVKSIDRKLRTCATNTIDLTSSQIETFDSYITDSSIHSGKIYVPSENLTEGIVVLYPTSRSGKTFRGYTLYDYVKSPGDSKIITDVVPNLNSKMSAVILFTSDYYVYHPRIIAAGRDNTSESLCSSFENGSGKYGVKPGDGGYLKVSYGNSSSWTNYTTVLSDLNKHTYAFDHNSFYIDGTLIGSGNSSSFTAEDPFTLLGQKTADTTYTKNSAKIFYADFYQNGEPIRIMYPAKNSSNVVGLLDIITCTFYEPTGNTLTAE